MSRIRKVTPEVADRARKLKASGLSYQGVADELGISVGSVSSALKGNTGRPGWAAEGSTGGGGGAGVGRAPRLPRGPAGGTAAQAAEDVGEVEVPVPPAASREERIAILDEAIAGLRKQSRVELAAGNLAGFNQTTARIVAAIAQREKMTPPDPPSVDERPDMVAAARKAREKLRDGVERARRGAA